MTMNTIVRSLPAGEFKAHCLALLDEVAATGQALTVTKRGRPVARLVPIEVPRPLLGSVQRQTNLVSPINITWDAER
jgi:prevent-host-death family protein